MRQGFGEANLKRYEEDYPMREQQEHLQQEEIKARSELERQARLWEQCRNLRDFIDAAEEALERTDAVGPGTAPAIWLAWARKHVERTDPMTSGYLKAAVTKNAHVQGPSIALDPVESYLNALLRKL